MTGIAPAGGVVKESERAVENAADSPLVRGLGRSGMVARGALYLVVALLAVRVAQGRDGERADKEGALQAVARQPVGKLLLVLLAVGFAGYALWRFSEMVLGPPGETNERKAKLKRVGSALRGLLYVGLFVSAVSFITRSNGDQAGATTSEVDWTARVLGWPGGRWLVIIVGVGVMCAGAYMGWRGLSRKFRKRLKMIEMRPLERRLVTGLGLVGNVARMVVAVVVGLFLISAAGQHDPGQAVGIDGALKRLGATDHGYAWLITVAAGLAAYGVYSLAEARYRRLEGQ